MKKIVLGMVVLASFGSLEATAMHRQKAKKTMAKSPKELLVGTWELNYLEGEEVANLYKDKLPELTFEVGATKVSGNNSCNGFGGEVVVTGQKIVFSDKMIQTMMACEGSGEQKFMEALRKVQSYAFSDADKLDLIAGDRGLMQLTKVAVKK